MARDTTPDEIICRSWHELEAHHSGWNTILDSNPSLTIFSTPEWLQSWWEAFGANKELLGYVISHKGVVVGVVPLFRERVGSLSRLRLVGDGSGDSDNLDIIALPNYETGVVVSLLDWINSQPDALLEFNTLPSDSTAIGHITGYLSNQPWHVSTSRQPRATVMLPGTWADYLSRVSHKQRDRMGYLLRRLQRRHQVEFSRCDNATELDGRLESLFALHQKRWQLKGETGSFASPERRAFYYAMGHRFLARGWLKLWSLTLDGKTVAQQLAFAYRDRVFTLQEGFDPDYSHEGVGYALRTHVLRCLIESGVRRYEFLGGDQESKRRWGSEIGHYVDIKASRTLKGILYAGSREASEKTREWLRRRIPAPIKESIRFN